MEKFLRDFLCAIMCFAIFEFNLYVRDYNQLMIMAKYVVYDYHNSELEFFNNEKFSVEIRDGIEGKEFVIVMERYSLLNIKSLKTIEYRGLVE